MPWRAAAVGLASALVTLVLATPVHAGQTITVGTTADGADPTPGNGVCQPVPCTLRAAIQTANSDPGSTINIPGSLTPYTLTVGGAGEDASATGDLDVTGNLTIVGVGAAGTIVDGGDLDRVLDVRAGTVAISGVTLRNGMAPASTIPPHLGEPGGGLRTAGSSNVTVTDSTITSNEVLSAGHGGGVASLDTSKLTLQRVLVSQNLATRLPQGGGGGGVSEESPGVVVKIFDSTVAQNQAQFAAGVWDDGTGRVEITHSTVSSNNTVPYSSNTVQSGGGVVEGAGTVVISDSAITGNTSMYGAGVIDEGGTLTIIDSTVSNNHAQAVDPPDQAAQSSPHSNGVGAGLLEYGGGTITVTDSTFSGNVADLNGGGMLFQGGADGAPVSITNSTISQNSAGTGGGGIKIDRRNISLLNATVDRNSAPLGADLNICNGGPPLPAGFCTGGTLRLRNSIVSGGSSNNCSKTVGVFSSDGHNLDSGTSCGFGAAGDKTGLDPQLNTLAANGGPTQTQSLRDGSPAVDAAAGCPFTDQRGIGRPVGPACDMGAFEGSIQLIDTTITSGPVGPTTDRTPTFTFSANPSAGATFECAVDQGAFAACDTPFTTTSLADGDYRLRVRAVSPAHETDVSPAVYDFTVDTVAPDTLITLVPNDANSQKVSGTKYSGTVRATAAEEGQPAGENSGVTRCVLDPPMPPATYEDVPVGQCPEPTTASIGSHTFYAASLDKAGNRGPVASVTFVVLLAPDTVIVGGPYGTTWMRDPEFTLISTLAGSTFKCRVDGGDFRPCTTPYRTFALSIGTHTISVSAVSQEGAVDLTPATRTITVADAETHDADCRVQPFRNVQGQSQLGCGWGAKCPARVPCGAALPACPVSAVCTISLNADFVTAEDLFLQVNLDDPNHQRFGIWSVQNWIGFAKRGDCDLALLNGNANFAHATCSVLSSTSFFGQNLPVTTYCAAAAYDSLVHPFTASPGDFGPEDKRSLACGARIKIAPASTLQAAAAGVHFELYAPQKGILDAVGDISPAKAARATIARRVNAFSKPLRKRVAKAGPVSFTPKLTSAAKRVLKRRGKLGVTLHVRFKPTTGKTITRTERVTLTQAANPRTQARAKLRAYCRKDRKARRLAACQRVL